MTYDTQLADRMRILLEGQPGLEERRMFGGLCFLVNGNMCCGIQDGVLILRLGEERATAGLEQPHTSLFRGTGKPMKSMLCIAPEGFEETEQLAAWLGLAQEFARSLPRKKA